MRSKLMVILRIITGMVFAISGFIKLMQPYQNFLVTIQSYEIVHGDTAVLLARSMPWVEFLFGVLLALGLWSRLAHSILWVLNSVFIGVLSFALVRNLPIQECGCFGESFSLKPSQTLAMDIGLWCIFLFMAAYFENTRFFSLDNKLDE